MRFNSNLGVMVRRQGLKAIARATHVVSEPLEQRTMLAFIPVTTTADGGPGSLRQAILDSNTSVGVLDTITFNIGMGGPETIAPLTDLPLITDPVIIDGTTQPGFTNKPIIEITGGSEATSAYGLEVDGGGTTIRGLVINDFLKVGIILDSDNNVVAGNYIGTDLAGTTAEGNGSEGIYVLTASGNRIGGTTAADRNVISGNDQEGINIAGVYVAAVTTPTPIPAQFTDSENNVVEGNYIGTDATGTLPLANTLEGVTVFEADDNTIGGTVAGAGNVISANGGDGVFISTQSSDSEPGGTGNKVEGNKIGTDATGTTDTNLGNSGNGVRVALGQNNLIGAAGVNGRNVISGNTDDGIQIVGDVGNISSGVGADSNTIQNNYIGTNAAGTAALGNGEDGILVDAGSQNLIGGSTAGLGNVVSGNGSAGIEMSSAYIAIIFGIFDDSNLIQGNMIGLNAAGTAPLENAGDGILLEGTSDTTVGGTAAAERNVISGNADDGIELSVELGIIGSLSSITNSIEGNYIGTNASGSSSEPNGGYGILITGAVPLGSTTNTIGGSAAGAANIISSNVDGGIDIDNGEMDVIQGNWIGTNPSGANLGNSRDGIEIDSATNEQIGGSAAGDGNVIAFNADTGVVIDGDSTSTSTDNAIRGNSIYSNGALGIDLGDDGVTPNDTDDVDTGPNNFQNYPVLTSAVSDSGSTTILGSINSNPGTTLVIEFFSNNAADPSGYGEGQEYLGSTTVTTDSTTGDAAIDVVLPVTLTSGQTVTATATTTASAPYGDTSEFSADIPGTVIAPPPTEPVISINNVSMTEGNSGTKNFVFTVKLSKTSTSNTTVYYATADGTAMEPSDYVKIPKTLLTFTAGQTTKTITVKVNGDTTVEPNETFFVDLSNPVNGTLAGDGKGTGTIINDDFPPPSGTVSIVPDPCDSSETALKFVGTNNADTILVTYAGAQGKASVTINGVNKGTFNFTGRILGYGEDGNDKITIDSRITRTAQIYGGNGNDTINGGSGNDLLFGGDGNDQLNGNAGRDILVGGLNNDLLNGGSGDDILIAGSTIYDNTDQGWCQIQDEWFRTDLSYSARVSHLINGGGKNGSYKLNASDVFSSASEPDTLTGGTGSDLFYAASSGDKVTDKASNETMVIVHSQT